jgi:hypothetical protein
VAADAPGAAGGPSSGDGSAAPTLLVVHNQGQDDQGNTHLLLDAHQPFTVGPGTANGSPAPAAGTGVNIQA